MQKICDKRSFKMLEAEPFIQQILSHVIQGCAPRPLIFLRLLLCPEYTTQSESCYGPLETKSLNTEML